MPSTSYHTLKRGRPGYRILSQARSPKKIPHPRANDSKWGNLS
ncbi:MAG: hypothetical protein VKJ02_19055 [Snowella sp.]|nr:hypothetical protein [Snowella sp.]